MRAEPWLVAVVVLLAGCVGGSEPDAIVPEGFDQETTDEDAAADQGENDTLPPEARDTGPSVLHYTGEFQLTLTQAFAGSQRTNLDNNCVNFQKGSVWLIFNGTATATWNAQSPFAERVGVELWDGGGQGLLAGNTGSSSPSVVEFGQFRITQASTLGLSFVIQTVDPGVVAEQAVTLAIDFNYVGRSELPAKAIPCIRLDSISEEAQE